MQDILCVYYSRTGTTRTIMEKIAEALDAELLEITDGRDRKGAVGFVTSGFDAMKKTPQPLLPFETARPLAEYEQVILGTPVWAGRCSSITHAFLQAHGAELPERVAYVITHLADNSYTEVFGQMDQYLKTPHVLGLTLQPKAEDRHRKIYDFIRALKGETEEETEEAEEEKSPAAAEETAAEEASEKTEELSTEKIPAVEKPETEKETEKTTAEQ